MKFAKFMVFAAVLGLATMISSQASAAVYSYSTTLLAWASDPVEPGDEFNAVPTFDKTFTLESYTNFPDAQQVTFFYNDIADSYSVVLGAFGPGGLENLPTGVTHELEYNVEIDASVLKVFKSVDLDVIHFTDTTTATKTVHRDAARTLLAVPTLTSVNGSTDSEVFGGALKKIWVTDTYLASAGGSAFGLNNVFTQQGVPEPTTLALWGGMMGLGLLYNRRRAAKR